MKRPLLIVGSAVVVAAVLAFRFVLPNAELSRQSMADMKGRTDCGSASIISGSAVAKPRCDYRNLKPQALPRAETEIVDAVSPVRGALSDETVRRLFQSSPEDAANHLLTLPPGPEREEHLLDLAAMWAEVDPGKAADRLLNRIATSEELALAGEIAAAWARSAPLSALAWFEAKDMSEDLRLVTLGHLYAEWAGADPEAAATHALLSGAGEVDETLCAALTQWMEGSAPAAIDWFSENIEAEQQARLAPNLAVALAQQDDEVAERFVFGQEENPAWQDVAFRTAYALASVHPELAERIAADLDDETAREAVLSRIGRLLGNVSSDEAVFSSGP